MVVVVVFVRLFVVVVVVVVVVFSPRSPVEKIFHYFRILYQYKIKQTLLILVANRILLLFPLPYVCSVKAISAMVSLLQIFSC